MKQIKMGLLLTILFVLLVGCGNKKKDGDGVPSPTPEATVAPTTEVKKEDTHEGMLRSRLTNEWVPEEKGNHRPYAIMLSNIKAANPQSGSSQASIIYECLVEGGITRLMGIFEDFDSEKIGSVRSARHYYASIADEYDAIFVHYGESKYTEAKLNELGVDNLSGLTSIGSTVFYRDKNIKAPHNAFASYNGIVKGTEKLKYRTDYRENYTKHYDFYDEDTTLSSESTANKVTIGFSKSYSPYFVYDEQSKLYGRYQFGREHIDRATKEQLTFKNILIQFVSESTMDDKGRQDMDFSNASGKGYYITNGKAMKISWKKNESDKTMSYYDEEGNLLKVNTGKTYIAVFPNTKVENISMK